MNEELHSLADVFRRARGARMYFGIVHNGEGIRAIPLTQRPQLVQFSQFRRSGGRPRPAFNINRSAIEESESSQERSP
jgi:hypothetical protein